MCDFFPIDSLITMIADVKALTEQVLEGEDKENIGDIHDDTGD